MSQVEVYTRLFLGDDKMSKEMKRRFDDLIHRESFDEDCKEFHLAYEKTGLDFAMCYCAVRHPPDMREDAYRSLVVDL